ncbi:MAG TPA: IS110 family transposase [Woeseiaceae bacterium]
MKKRWLCAGVDLGVESASVCIINDAGEAVHEGHCAATARDVRHELVRFRKPRFARVVIEAGTGTHVARGLRSYGYPVELYETRQLSKFLRIRRNKTDAGDAKSLAEAGRISAALVSKVHLKSLESQAILSRLTIRRHLIRQRVASTSMLERQIELFGGRLRTSSSGQSLTVGAEGQIRKYLWAERAPAPELRFLVSHCERLIAYQKELDRDLIRLARQDEVCQRLMEIPGVGPICALAFVAAVDDPDRFSQTSAIGSYFGLAPKVYESGLTSRKPRISKMGNKNVRSLLVNSAGKHLRYCGHNTRLRQWAMGIEERRGRMPSRVALARKLAVIMLAMWKSGAHFRNAIA